MTPRPLLMNRPTCFINFKVFLQGAIGHHLGILQGPQPGGTRTLINRRPPTGGCPQSSQLPHSHTAIQPRIQIAKQPHSHVATQPHSHIATQLQPQLHSYIATEAHGHIAAQLQRVTQRCTFSRAPFCEGGQRPPPFAAMQPCGYVALWLCSYVAMWKTSNFQFFKFTNFKLSFSSDFNFPKFIASFSNFQNFKLQSSNIFRVSDYQI